MTVEDALEVDPEWILFMDSDVIPPADVFPRLRNRGVDSYLSDDGIFLQSSLNPDYHS